jgi:hypothetical protein
MLLVPCLLVLLILVFALELDYMPSNEHMFSEPLIVHSFHCFGRIKVHSKLQLLYLLEDVRGRCG